MFRQAVVSIGLLAMTGCGQQAQNSLPSSVPQVKPMFVLMGGYTTCDERRDGSSDSQTVVENPAAAPDPNRVLELPRFRELLAKAPNYFGVTPEYVVSCYSAQDNSIYFLTSRAPNEIRSSERPEFIETIENMMTTGAPIYLIGHSHGGWLSIKTANDLAQNHRLKALFSIDPISRTGCTTSIFSNCTSAPRDISTQERQFIKSKTEKWQNFYQTETSYLHSSPIDQATINLKVTAPHTEIQLTDIVWQSIDAAVYQ